MIGRTLCLFVFCGLSCSLFAARHQAVLTDRIATAADDYVFVVAAADKGLGLAPNSREAVLAAMNAGADIVEVKVIKDKEGKLVLSDGFPLAEAARLIDRKALLCIAGAEAFPQQAINVLYPVSWVYAVMFKSALPLEDLRKGRLGEAGLDDRTTNEAYTGRMTFVPTVDLDAECYDAAQDISWLRLCSVKVSEEKNVGRLSRFAHYKGKVSFAFDTTESNTCAGRTDLKALADPEANWGWCLKHGARAIRTSRPAELAAYLKKKGRHDLCPPVENVSYSGKAGAEVSIPTVLVPAPREMKDSGRLVSADVLVSVSYSKKLPAEGYALKVSSDGVKIVAADEDGAFWARQTLRQLEVVLNGHKLYHEVTIRDWPEYRWRGALLDDSRHFIGFAGVTNFLAAMAYNKLNVFHWHPDDDQGWRIPLKSFPDLEKFGSSVIRDGGKYTYGPYFYKEEEVRSIMTFAKANHIEIVPEFEIPGHGRALVSSYPELACAHVRPKQGIPYHGLTDDESVQPNVICAGDDEVLHRLDVMLDEFCEHFPGLRTIHLGGDEVNYGYWKKCPKCQERIRKFGLGDEKGLQRWVMRRFVDRLAKKGVKAIGWDEVVDGGVPPGMQIMYWRRGNDSVRRALAAGVPVVSCSSAYCYFDREQMILDDPYFSWGKVTLPTAYSYDPYEGAKGDARKLVQGTEGLMWGEEIRNVDELMWKAYPRLCATAEIGWTNPPCPRNYADFVSRLATHIVRMRKLGFGSAHTPEGVPVR